jgi:phosphotransferase system HPr (HPr) family protein
VSGFSTEEFVFGGFLPPKPGKRRRILEGLRSESRPVVLFEAPHRIKATLEDLGEIMGDRPMVALREMTKRFEDVRRGTAAEILAGLSPESIRGEFTLVVSGSREKVPDEVGEEARGRIDELVAEGRLGVKEMALLLSEETGLPYRMLYKECLAEMKDAETHRTMELVKQFRIRNSMGLHARAAAKIVDLSNKFKSRLYLKKDGQEVDGSSILSILTLSCPKGCEIEARVAGEDCREFMDGLGLLFEQRFGEDR